MNKPKILVVGSMVMDLIISTERFPNAGETVLGQSFRTAPGGKGANQAVQAARLGADVTMVGKVGNDSFGDEMLASMSAAGVDVSQVMRTSEHATAVGGITLTTKDGVTLNNRIIVVSGANMAITPEEVAYLKEEIGQYSLVMLQLEIPREVNEIVASYARAKGVQVMLNSAPYAPISDYLLSCLTYISPNEHEAAGLTGITIREEGQPADRARVGAAVEMLHEKGVEKAIITLGDQGAVVAGEDLFVIRPCVSGIKVADPTAAGDSFVGAFCSAVCAGLTDEQALVFANHTAAITVSRMGAQPSLPTLDEVLALMEERGFDEFPLSLLNRLKGE